MVDVFISYSRADQAKVAVLAREIAAAGYEVWWDKDLPPHLSYGDVITAKITEAKAAVVVWSETAAASEWVRAEADVARNQKKLIQVASDGVIPPLPFNQIQCASLSGWRGEPDHPGWSKVKQSLAALCRDGDAAPAAPSAQPQPAMKRPNPAAPPPRKPSRTDAPPPAAKSGASNVLILGGLGGLLAVGLLIWMGVMASEGGDAVTAADVAAPPEAAADTATTEPMAAMDPNLAPPPAAPEAATGALQQAPSLGVVATIEDAVMWLVDENGNETGAKLVLPMNENLEVLAVYDEYAITRRDDGTIGYVKNTAVQDVSASAAE